MQTLNPVTLADGIINTINLIPDTIGVLIANESPLSININMVGRAIWLPAWTLDYIPLQSQQTVSGTLSFTPKNISNAANSPSSVALITFYAQGDVLHGTYPCALTRQTNIGNGSIAANVNSIANDGNPISTSVIEATPVTQVSSAISLDNSGDYILRTLDSGVWTTILNIIAGVSGGAATKLFHGTADVASAVAATGVTAGTFAAGVLIPGGQVSGNVAQATNLNSAITAVDTPGGHYDVVRTPQVASAARDILLQTWDGSAAVNILQLGSNGTGFGTPKAHIDNNGATTVTSLSTPTGGTLNAFSTFTGAASGTYTHGLSVTPLAVSALQKVAASTNTYGSDTYGSTSVHINVFSSPQAFVAIAVA